MNPLPVSTLDELELSFQEIIEGASVWNRQDGIYNNNYGKKHSDETKQKIREKAIGRKPARLGATHSDETKEKMRQKAFGRASPRKGVEPWNKGKTTGPQERIECTNCGGMFTKAAIARWHGSNCKHRV